MTNDEVLNKIQEAKDEKLKYLDLSENQLTVLPKEIGNLTNLEGLVLSENQLTVLPKEIGNLANLEWLYLSNNQLTVLPKEIGNLTNLERLYLRRNESLKEIPLEITNNKNLTIFK